MYNIVRIVHLVRSAYGLHHHQKRIRTLECVAGEILAPGIDIGSWVRFLVAGEMKWSGGEVSYSVFWGIWFILKGILIIPNRVPRECQNLSYRIQSHKKAYKYTVSASFKFLRKAHQFIDIIRVHPLVLQKVDCVRWDPRDSFVLISNLEATGML